MNIFIIKCIRFFGVTGDSFQIHEFAYSFIGLCSVTSNMTGYAHSYHLIKLIHCGAPQRDVVNDKMVLWVVTHIFYLMLCQSSLLSTVISFAYKDKWWLDESMSVIFCMENTWKRIVLFPLMKSMRNLWQLPQDLCHLSFLLETRWWRDLPGITECGLNISNHCMHLILVWVEIKHSMCCGELRTAKSR